MRKLLSTSLVLALFAGCTADPGEDDPLGAELDDGKADSLSTPTRHNDYFFGTRADAQITGHARNHAWQFVLNDKATIHLEAFNLVDGEPSDTALYIYRKTSGSRWRLVESDRRDDGVDPQLTRELEQGTYRAIIRGKHRSTTQGASLWGTCDGQGCVDNQEACLFGRGGMGLSGVPDSYVHLSREGDQTLNDASFADGAHGSEAAMLRQAYRAATGQSVTSIDEVLGGIQGQLVRSRVASDTSYEGYSLFQFRTKAGQEVAAFFDVGSHPVSLTVDAEQRMCGRLAPVCAFGEDLNDLNRFYTVGEVRTIYAGMALSEVERKQILVAALHAPTGRAFATAEEALDALGPVNLASVVENQLGASYTLALFDYQLRDAEGTTSYGALFNEGDASVVAVVGADRFARCAVTRSRPSLPL